VKFWTIRTKTNPESKHHPHHQVDSKFKHIHKINNKPFQLLSQSQLFPQDFRSNKRE